MAQWKESQAAAPPEAAAEPSPEPSSAGAPAQEILSESETEIEVQIGEALYLVDLSAEMVFQILPEEAEVGRWDAASRTILFDDEGGAVHALGRTKYRAGKAMGDHHMITNFNCKHGLGSLCNRFGGTACRGH